MKLNTFALSSTLLVFISAVFISATVSKGNKTDKLFFNSGIVSEENIGTKLNPEDPINQFGQFVGVWDCDIQNRTADDSWIEGKATWTWQYILDNNAVQDFWHRHADLEKFPNSKDYHGTNVRIFNPDINKWMVSWIETGQMTISKVWNAHMEDDGSIKIYDDTNTWLITFYNIKEDSFDWKWEFKQDDQSMKTSVKISAKRLK